jgi:hypothetical protein
MQNNKLTLGIVLSALVLVAALGLVYLDRNMSGQAESQPETYSFSGKVKSVDSSTLVVESYMIVPDPSGSNPPRVETKDRQVRVNGKTKVFRKALGENGSTLQEESLAAIGPGKEVVVYSEEPATDDAQVYAQSVEIIN